MQFTYTGGKTADAAANATVVVKSDGMIQGTTPTHIFRLPIDTGTIRQLRITYSQNDSVVLEATEADVTLDGSEIRYRLTQEATLKFNPGSRVELQLKVLTEDGNVMASKVMQLSVSKILNTEVLE